MSGGFETIFSTAIIAIGVLSSPAGQMMQQMAYEDIMSVYETPEEAFERCVTEEKSAYIAGLVKEALRCYPPLKLLPARQTYKDFVYNGALIPKGILVYVNAQAVNRGKVFPSQVASHLLVLTGSVDKAIYGEDADEFRPERWMSKTLKVPPPYHFAFGAGARMCTAVNFADRVLYAVFLRLIVSFKMTESKSMPANTDYIGYKRDPAESNAIPSDFKIHLHPRSRDVLEDCFEKSQNNVAALATGDGAETLRR
jgi:phenylacetate 2-hydroxylase